MSDDGRNAITVIVFLGSVFSPFYFKSRDRSTTTPYDHCAMNVALYGCGRGNWSFTEYGRNRVACHADSLVLGQNRIDWNGQSLTCGITERAAPIPNSIRGTIRVHPETSTGSTLALDGPGRHWWQPLIPRARIEVAMEKPALRWSGTGYVDSNHGCEPLDDGMRCWSWLRAHTSAGTTIIYDVIPADGSLRSHALKINRRGDMEPFTPPPRVSLPKTGWRIHRETHADFGFVPTVEATLEDAPFYSRSVLDTQLAGERVKAVHESLSLERFRSSWVRALLPFRMRRARRRE